MSWELADHEVYQSISHDNYFPLKKLNWFKKDPRVMVGPEWGQQKTGMWWEFMKLGETFYKDEGRWFVFHARSRIYAIKGRTANDVKVFIESFNTKGRFKIRRAQ